MHKIIRDMLDASVRIDAWSYSRVQTFRADGGGAGAQEKVVGE